MKTKILDSSSSERYQKFRKGMEIEYYQMHLYVERILSSIDLKDIELDPKYLSLRNKINPENRIDDNYTTSIAPYLLKHSLFISIYSFLEYSLKEFCKIVAAQLDKRERRVSDFEKVYQFYYYLINDVQIDGSKTEKEWDKLNIFKDIRNSIVHYNSTIGKNISAKSYQFIKEDSRMKFEEPNSFKIEDHSLIYELIELSQKFIFTLMDEYENKYHSLKD